MYYLKGRRVRPKLDSAIAAVDRQIGDGALSHVILKSISKTNSTDFAALLLWQQLLRNPLNRMVHSLFAAEVSRLRNTAQGDAGPFTSDQKNYLIVFAPGWFYKSQPESGADFAEPRQVLDDAGMNTTLLQVDENGTVERNADIIAAQLVRLGRTEKDIIVVSASKGGPEVALALSRIHRTGTSHHVKAWVNVGGLLQGSALADKALSWPARWYAKLFGINGKSFEGIKSLATGISTERAKHTALPPEVVVLNYVGIPLSGQVSERARPGYTLLRSEGPNDGLTLILDEIPANSVTIAELGLDHYFDDPEIHLKTVALANTIIRLIEDRLF